MALIDTSLMSAVACPTQIRSLNLLYLLMTFAQISESTVLPGDDDGRATPYVLVGDEAFPLRPYLMRPFPGSTLNDERRVFSLIPAFPC